MQREEKKKLMIVGAGDFQLPIVEAAAAENRVVLVAPEIGESFEKYVCAKYFTDVRDREYILQVARSEGIDGIVTDQTDIPVRTVAYVAEQLGLGGIGYETSKLFTDKFLMRERLQELGLPYLPYRLTKEAHEAAEFFSEYPGDIIIKPVDTQGSRGVVRVSRQEDIPGAFAFAQGFSRDGRVLAEHAASGIEFVVEAVTDNFKCRNLICGDTVYFNNSSVFSAKKRTFPSCRPKELTDRVLDLNKRIVEGFRLPYGITHAEYIMDGDEIYLLEIAARGGGVYISSDLIYELTGFHPEDFLIKKALSQPAGINIRDTGVFAGYRAFYLPEGTVKEVTGAEQVLQLPYVRRTQLGNIRPGMKVGRNTNKTSRIAMIITADSAGQWEQRTQLIRDMLHVRSEAEDGSIQDIIWD